MPPLQAASVEPVPVSPANETSFAVFRSFLPTVATRTGCGGGTGENAESIERVG
jgi:hypothetical protein